MSPSKAASKAAVRAKAKPKAKSTAAAKRSSVETLRIIPAATAPVSPQMKLTQQDEARSQQGSALAADIEKALRAGEDQAALSPEALQNLLAALCKVYSQHLENGVVYDAFSQQNAVRPTDVMVTASGLLKAANLAVFELGMWQSWTGR